MEYIAHDTGSLYHASMGRERHANKSAVGGQGWQWKAKTACGKEVHGISGNAIVTMIDCDRCRAALKKDGWLF